MELQVWPGDWGLPSVDPQCLAVLVYCKLSKAPVTINKVSNPWRSPSGQFPVLIHSEGIESKVTQIFSFLQSQNYGIDRDLTAIQSSDCLAFSALIKKKLLPAVLYVWWVDSKSYVEFTRPWYASVLPFPLGMYVPLRKRNACIARLQATYGDDYFGDTSRESKIMRDAKECLNLLSANLGDKNYFFGSKPSSLDALVFGYIVSLLQAPLPNNMLQNHLKACQNLTQLSTRMLEENFPLTPQEREDLRRKEEQRHQKVNDVSEYPHRRRNLLIAGVVVVAAMISYSLLTGLVQIDFVNVEKNSESSMGKNNVPKNSEKKMPVSSTD
jgi:metaxin